jgi:hypothetical protein
VGFALGKKVWLWLGPPGEQRYCGGAWCQPVPLRVPLPVPSGVCSLESGVGSREAGGSHPPGATERGGSTSQIEYTYP